jgi:hypothetical protein
MQANDISEMQKEAQPVLAKRGWRFYGTFGTLALLNLICAIDATILSVALPVRNYLNNPHTVLTMLQENSYRSGRHHCNPGFLGWDVVPLVSLRQRLTSQVKLTLQQVFDSLPTFVGIFLAHQRPKVRYPGSPITFYSGYHHRINC